MSEQGMFDLYQRLPALYRLEDDKRGEVLKALLAVVQEQAEVLKQNIDELYDDFFIETCAEWAIPYIGDLVGNNPLYEVLRTRRADVARTLYYRRRKGTLAMLEELARDVTGWAARAVPFFELLAWTQNVNHVRLEPAPDLQARHPLAFDRVGAAHLRSPRTLQRLNGPFDRIAHTVDVRPIDRRQGWHNVRNVGFFLWRLENHCLEGVTARQAQAPNQHGYHFSPLGNPVRLYAKPSDLEEGGFAGEEHVPAPMCPWDFLAETERFYGAGLSLLITTPAGPVPASQIFCMNLANWERPAAGKVGVDLERGRISFAAGEEPAGPVVVTYNYGFSADTGGGPYDRSVPVRAGERLETTAATALLAPAVTPITVGEHADWNTLTQAIAHWVALGRPGAIIQIEDSRAYVEDLTVPMGGGDLIIQAANRSRPALLGDIHVSGGAGTEGLMLSGLLISGSVRLTGKLGRLGISHCTLVPGRTLGEDGEPAEPHLPSLVATPSNDSLKVDIERSITGRLQLPAEIGGLEIRDGIIDAAARNDRAQPVQVLLSGNLAPMPVLTSATPRLRIRIGAAGPWTLTLSPAPTTMAEARDRLQEAIRAAFPGNPAFSQASVVTISNRLAVLSGTGEAVEIGASPGDASAQELRLLPGLSRQLMGLLGGKLDAFAGLSTPAPAVAVTIGLEGPCQAAFAAAPATLAAARDELQAAIRGASATPSFSAAAVAISEQRLLVLPGSEGVCVSFGPAPADRSTLTELALESARPALAGSEGAEYPGPASTLLATTVLGKVHVRELALVADVVFDDTVRVERKQAGCVRFSYVPEGSSTPRRHRCQPETALEGISEEECPAIRLRLVPSYTSRRFGDAGYGQLHLACAEELRAGAENGAEMGAFNHLQQPQRLDNFRIRLEEYLPFGLTAGLILES